MPLASASKRTTDRWARFTTASYPVPVAVSSSTRNASRGTTASARGRRTSSLEGSLSVTVTNRKRGGKLLLLLNDIDGRTDFIGIERVKRVVGFAVRRDTVSIHRPLLGRLGWGSDLGQCAQKRRTGGKNEQGQECRRECGKTNAGTCNRHGEIPRREPANNASDRRGRARRQRTIVKKRREMCKDRRPRGAFFVQVTGLSKLRVFRVAFDLFAGGGRLLANFGVSIFAHSFQSG